MTQVRIKIGPRHRQHVLGGIDTGRAVIERCKKFQHAAGAGAEIEQTLERPRPQCFEHGAFDRILGHMQPADGVPRFREDSGGGWVTADYMMMPGSASLSGFFVGLLAADGRGSFSTVPT